MFFVLLIIGLIIAIIIVLTVRYPFIQAHILSSREFRKAAERQALGAKEKNPK